MPIISFLLSPLGLVSSCFRCKWSSKYLFLFGKLSTRGRIRESTLYVRLAVSVSVSALSSEWASSLSRRLEGTNQTKSVFLVKTPAFGFLLRLRKSELQTNRKHVQQTDQKRAITTFSLAWLPPGIKERSQASGFLDELLPFLRKRSVINSLLVF